MPQVCHIIGVFEFSWEKGYMASRLSELVKLNLRLSVGLRRRLETAAERNRQSINTEILVRLEDSFRNEDIRDVVQKAVRDFYDEIKGPQ
jgi:hypothetical protein